MKAPELRFAFQAEVEIGAPPGFGKTQNGHWRVIPVMGGCVEGERLKGRLAPGVAEWQILRPDGPAELDARHTIGTDRGALIHVVNRGVRNGPPGAGERYADKVVLRFWEVS